MPRVTIVEITVANDIEKAGFQPSSFAKIKKPTRTESKSCPPEPVSRVGQVSRKAKAAVRRKWSLRPEVSTLSEQDQALEMHL